MVREQESLLIEDRPYRIGVALSGGGAKGFAHVGALKALEELGIRPDIISGTSAGSIVGVLYADGYSPDEILDLFTGLSFNDLAEMTLPRTSLFKIERFRQFFGKALRAQRFEELSLPIAVTATNLDEGEPVTWFKGGIVDRVTASCSIPIVFPPVLIDGIHYVDGGVLCNLPVEPIRPLCDYVIGVNVSPLINDGYSQTLSDIANRTYKLMAKSNTFDDVELCDVCISIEEATKYTVFDLQSLHEIAELGYHRTLNQLNALPNLNLKKLNCKHTL